MPLKRTFKPRSKVLFFRASVSSGRVTHIRTFGFSVFCPICRSFSRSFRPLSVHSVRTMVPLTNSSISSPASSCLRSLVTSSPGDAGRKSWPARQRKHIIRYKKTAQTHSFLCLHACTAFAANCQRRFSPVFFQ